MLGVSAPWLTKRAVSRKIGGAGGDMTWEINTPTPPLLSIITLVMCGFGSWYSLYRSKLISKTKLIVGGAVCVLPFALRTTSGYKYFHWILSDVLSSVPVRVLAYTTLIAGHHIYVATFKSDEKQTQATLTKRVQHISSNSRDRSRSIRSNGSQKAIGRQGSTGSIRSLNREYEGDYVEASNSPVSSPRGGADPDYGPMHEATQSKLSRSGRKRCGSYRKRTMSASSLRRSLKK